MRAERARNLDRIKRDLSSEQREQLFRALKARFENNMNRHKGHDWAQVQAKLEANAEKRGGRSITPGRSPSRSGSPRRSTSAVGEPLDAANGAWRQASAADEACWPPTALADRGFASYREGPETRA